MKKLYLVETTTGEAWETNTGFHFVMAEDKKDATKITNAEKPYEKIINVDKVDQLMRLKVFKTIIDSQVE